MDRDYLFYYEGYEITKVYYLLNEEETHVLYACIWMVDNKTTIRTTAKNWCYSRMTFWRRIHKECKSLSPELYKVVCRQLKENHIRGMNW